MYGIYDLSGALSEKISVYLANGSSSLKSNGSLFTYNGNNLITDSTKYVKVYEHDTTKDNVDISDESLDLNAIYAANYLKNAHVYGNALNETSTEGTGSTSWYDDFSQFLGRNSSFLIRGGTTWSGRSDGVFAFSRGNGEGSFFSGFRPIVVPL